MLKDTLQSDLKAAMLSGDKQRVSVLNMLKGAILNQEIADGLREAGLSDEQVIAVFTKELKKRREAADLYAQAGNQEKAAAENFEAEVIAAYLPAQIPDDEILGIITDVMNNMGEVSSQDMGRIIGAVKAKAGSAADGGRIAALVKEKLS